jgi:hypothetical protein
MKGGHAQHHKVMGGARVPDSLDNPRLLPSDPNKTPTNTCHTGVPAICTQIWFPFLFLKKHFMQKIILNACLDVFSHVLTNTKFYYSNQASYEI